VTLPNQSADALNCVLTAYILRRSNISKIPAREGCSEGSAAPGEFEVFSRGKVDQFTWHLVEKSKQRMNFGAERVRDSTSIELVPACTKEGVDGFNYLAWKDLWHCTPWGLDNTRPDHWSCRRKLPRASVTAARILNAFG
jgi:hypothetical protein